MNHSAFIQSFQSSVAEPDLELHHFGGDGAITQCSFLNTDAEHKEKFFKMSLI
jgi:carotenoid cleavage dioxygenase-like enzyme